MLDLVPQPLDTVEFGAVGGQKIQAHALLFEPFDTRPDALGLVDGCVIQNHRQGLCHLLTQPAQKADKHIRSRGLPILGAQHLAAG